MAKRLRDEQADKTHGDSQDPAEKPRKTKKRKHAKSGEENSVSSQTAPTERAKKKDTAREKSASPDAFIENGEPGAVDQASKTSKTASSKDSSSQKKKARFIVFVGNLPYTATNESITEHFSKIHPESIRHITEKPSDAVNQKQSKSRKGPKGPKSKGFAFLEFEGYDRMKTCLKLYHHSSFDDGKSPARKINVELTAGGGGNKSKARNEKLKAKNEKLAEERELRREKEIQKRSEKPDRAEPVPMGAGDVHPSRRSRVPSK